MAPRCRTQNSEDLKLYYERAGTGEPELLFVPGWCCDHTAFQPQFDHFARTHAVTALDLRGCGQSDQPDDGYTIPELADDVARLCAEVGIEKPVIAGHSLGGMIAVELAARYPSLPSALVLVDPGPIDPSPESGKIYSAFAEEMAGPNGEEVRRAWVQDMGARDEELARWIVELMCAVPLPIAAAVDPRPQRLERRRRLRALHRPDAVAAGGARRRPGRPAAARDQARPRGRASRSGPATSTSSRSPSR